MNRWGITLLLMAATLVGCTVGPSYKKPEIKAPARWVSPLKGGETNAMFAHTQWWKSFNDPELDSLIARATPSNLTVRIVYARVREARAALRFSRAGLGPTLDAKTSFTKDQISKNGFPPFPPGTPLTANIYDTGFDAAWELDVFGGLHRGVEAAQAEVAASEFELGNAILTLHAEIARNYVDFCALQRRLNVARKNIEAQRDIVNLTTSLFQNGLTSELDVQQGKSLLSATEAQVPALESSRTAAIYHLAVLLGQPPGALLGEMTHDRTVIVSPPVVPVGLPSDLLLRRPDVRRAERQLAAATARIGVAVADLFPKFSLTGDIGLQSVSASDWFTPSSRYWTFGPTVQWRLFDTGRIRANIEIQNSREEQALASYEQTVLTAFEDVENAMTGYANEQLRRESLVEAIQADKSALELARELYANGLADFQRVLESERTLYQVEDAEIESERAISNNLIALFKALGGGWQDQMAQPVTGYTALPTVNSGYLTKKN